MTTTIIDPSVLLDQAREAARAAHFELYDLRQEREELVTRLAQAQAIFARETTRDQRLGLFDEQGRPRASQAQGAALNVAALTEDLADLDAAITAAEAAAAVVDADLHQAEQAARQRDADDRAHLLIEHQDLTGEMRAIVRDLEADRTDPAAWEAYTACYARFQALRRRGPFDRREQADGTFTPPADGFGGLWWPPDPESLLLQAWPVADPLLPIKRVIADTLIRYGDEQATSPAPVPSMAVLAGLEKRSRA